MQCVVLSCLSLLLLFAPLTEAAKRARAMPKGPPGAATATPQIPFTLAWDWTNPVIPDNWTVLRCQPTGTAKTCTPTTALPTMPISGTLFQYTDPTPVAGSVYCWTAVATKQGYDPSPPASTTAGVPYVCSQLGGVLPIAGPIQVQAVGGKVRLTWSAPQFTSTTVPASTLTGFAVWARTDNPVGSWRQVATVSPTTLTYDYAAPPGRNCYQIGAVYGALGRVDNVTVCAAAPLPPLPAPTNLREVVATTP